MTPAANVTIVTLAAVLARLACLAGAGYAAWFGHGWIAAFLVLAGFTMFDVQPVTPGKADGPHTTRIAGDDDAEK